MPPHGDFEIDAMTAMIELRSPARRRQRRPVLDTQESVSSGNSSSSVVAFSDNDRVIEYECDDSESSLWLCADDIKSFKKQCHETVEMAMSGSLSAFPDFCDRGLEGFTAAGKLQSRSRKKHARSVVLEEQERQRASNTFDPERLSEGYSRATTRSRLLAAALGQGDEVAAR